MAIRTLSPREIEVLECLSRGMNGTDTASELGISPHTVTEHKSRLFKKLDVQTAAGAVAIGLREGIIS